MKKETIYLRVAFDFTDDKGNLICDNISYDPALGIPLAVNEKEIGFKERAIIENAIADMVVELIQSGQINHLCPQIQDRDPVSLDKNAPLVPQQYLPVVVFDAQIQDKGQTFQSELSPGKMSLEKWGGFSEPDLKG